MCRGIQSKQGGRQIGRIFAKWANFRQMADCFLWAVFFITAGAPIFGYLFFSEKVMY
jgi:hypothetical protein